MDRLLYEDLTWNIGVVHCPHFPHEKFAWVKEEFWNISFEDKKVYGLNIPHQMHLKAYVNKHKFIIIQGVDIYEESWYKVASFAQSTYMVYCHEPLDDHQVEIKH